MDTDAELLARYADGGDEDSFAKASEPSEAAKRRREAAFAELVGRHGGAVYRACLRQLADSHEAEDAAQAVFMALARRAKSLGRRPDLAGWLHAVARQTALFAARSRARRNRRQEEVAMLRSDDGRGEERGAGDEADIEQARSLLDQELAGLPAAQRQAIVLRYLEGRSEAESAEIAGVPQGTLSQRASRGLDRLRERLTRRGVSLGAVAILGLLEAEAAAAAEGALPAGLLPSIVAASKCAAAPAAAGAAGTLMEGVLRAMFWRRVRVVAAGLAGMAAIALTALTAVLAQEPRNPSAGGPGAAQAVPAPELVSAPLAAPAERAEPSWHAPRLVAMPGNDMHLPAGLVARAGVVQMFMTSVAGPAEEDDKPKGKPALLAAVSRDRGAAWTSFKNISDSTLLSFVGGGGRHHLCASKTTEVPMVGGSGEVLYVQLSPDGKELRRSTLLPAGKAGELWESVRILASGEKLVTLALCREGDRITGGAVLRSSDGGASWAGPVKVSAQASLVPNMPVAFMCGDNVYWFQGVAGKGSGLSAAISTDAGATWKTRPVPAFKGESDQKFAVAVPMTCAVSGRNVYLVVLGSLLPGDGLQPRNPLLSKEVGYYLIRSHDGGESWLPAMALASGPGAAAASPLLALTANGDQVVFGWIDGLGSLTGKARAGKETAAEGKAQQAPSRIRTSARFCLSRDRGVTWENLHAFDGIRGASMWPMAAFDAETGDLHIAALVLIGDGTKPDDCGMVVRTYGTAQQQEAAKLPDWWQEKEPPKPTPELF